MDIYMMYLLSSLGTSMSQSVVEPFAPPKKTPPIQGTATCRVSWGRFFCQEKDPNQPPPIKKTQKQEVQSNQKRTLFFFVEERPTKQEKEKHDVSTDLKKSSHGLAVSLGWQLVCCFALFLLFCSFCCFALLLSCSFLLGLIV